MRTAITMSVPSRVMKPNLSVMIVEANKAQADLLTLMLQPTLPQGRFYHAETMSEALSLLTLREPDLIFYDISAPNRSQLKGLAELRRAAPRVAVVVLAGRHDDDMAFKALSAGAQDYLIRERLDQETLSRSVRYAVARGEHLQLTARLERESKLSTLGQIVAALSHQINNPASVMMSNVEMMRCFLRDSREATSKGEYGRLPGYFEEMEECLQDSHLGLERIKKLVDEIGAYTGATENEPEVSSLKSVMQATMAALEGMIPEHVGIQLDLEDDVNLKVPYQRVFQVVSAVVCNALEAFDSESGVGRVRIKTFNYDDHVILKIRDNAGGISPMELRRVFEPFYSSKEKHVGLGLTLAQEVARSYQGELEVESSMGRGTVVTINLPRKMGKLGVVGQRGPFMTPMLGNPSLAHAVERAIRVEDGLDVELFWERTTVDEETQPRGRRELGLSLPEEPSTT